MGNCLAYSLFAYTRVRILRPLVSCFVAGGLCDGGGRAAAEERLSLAKEGVALAEGEVALAEEGVALAREGLALAGAVEFGLVATVDKGLALAVSSASEESCVSVPEESCVAFSVPARTTDANVVITLRFKPGAGAIKFGSEVAVSESSCPLPSSLLRGILIDISVVLEPLPRVDFCPRGLDFLRSARMLAMA